MKIFLFFTFLLFSTMASSQVDSQATLAQALQQFKLQQYDEMVDTLEAIDLADDAQKALQYYMLGLGYNRVEEHQKAINNFGKALLLKIRKEDIFYEMGQAYYAQNELKVAKDFFVKSYNAGFKKIASLYYLGHISQLLGEDIQAKSYYLEIAKSANAELNLKQIATYQLAEIIYQKYEGSNYLVKKVLRRYVFPLLDEAYNADKNSELAQEIANRKQQLIRQFKMDAIVMRNGREVSKRLLNVQGSIEIKYDDNVTNVADNPAQSSTTKEASAFSDASIVASYNYIPNTSLIVTPSVRLKNEKYYSDQSTVYSNDSTVAESKINASIEHTLLNRPASASFAVGYDYKKKDYLGEKSQQFYGETYRAEVAERFRWNNGGDTQLRLQYKNYVAYSEALDTNSYIFDAYQTFLVMNKHYLVGSYLYDQTVSDVESNESTTHSLSLNYFIPQIFKRLDATFSYTFSLVNTELKGNELSHTPSIELAQNIGKNWQLQASCRYTQNSADEEQYTYSKVVTGLGLRYSY